MRKLRLGAIKTLALEHKKINESPAEDVLAATVRGAVLYPSVGPLRPGLVLLNLLPMAHEDALSFLALLVKHALLLLQLSLVGTVKVT